MAKKDKLRQERLRIALLVYHFLVQKTQIPMAAWRVPNRHWLTAQMCDNLYRNFFQLDIEDSRALYQTAKKMVEEGFWKKITRYEDNEPIDWFAKGDKFYPTVEKFLQQAETDSPWLEYLRGKLFFYRLMEDSDYSAFIELMAIIAEGSEDFLDKENKLNMNIVADIINDDYLEKKKNALCDPLLVVLKSTLDIEKQNRQQAAMIDYNHQELSQNLTSLDDKLSTAVEFILQQQKIADRAEENEQLKLINERLRKENEGLLEEIQQRENELEKIKSEKEEIELEFVNWRYQDDATKELELQMETIKKEIKEKSAMHEFAMECNEKLNLANENLRKENEKLAEEGLRKDKLLEKIQQEKELIEVELDAQNHLNDRTKELERSLESLEAEHKNKCTTHENILDHLSKVEFELTYFKEANKKNNATIMQLKEKLACFENRERPF